MPFNPKMLYNDEEVVVDLHPHWWYLTPRLLVLLAAMGFGIWALTFQTENAVEPAVRFIAAAAVVAAVVSFIARVIDWRSSNFVVTTERCIYRTGILRKEGIEIPLDRINTVYFNQTFFERMLKSGDIAIESASGDSSRQEFSNILNPNAVQHTIYRMMEDHDNRRLDRIGSEAREAAVGAVAGREQVASLSVAEQLEKLHDLVERGAISPEEYELQKNQLLG